MLNLQSSLDSCSVFDEGAMFEGSAYFPAFSTRTHEQRAYSKCTADVKDLMTPIVTLTRFSKSETFLETAEILLRHLEGRLAIVDFDDLPRPTTSAEEAAKRRKMKNEKRVASGKSESRERSEKELANEERDRKRTERFNLHVSTLTDPISGPLAWLNLVSVFPNLIPVLSTGSAESLASQLAYLRSNRLRGALRIDPRKQEDVTVFLDNIGAIREQSSMLVLILDLKDIRGKTAAAEEASIAFLAQVFEGSDGALETVLIANSFPKTGLKDFDPVLEIEERSLFRKISKTFSVKYGDYMSIPPTRSSTIATGWFPHVDLVCDRHWHIHLYENNSDATKYVVAAGDATGGDIWARKVDCWGSEIIEQVAAGDTVVDGTKFTIPGPWLSVRANQHLTHMARSR